MMCAGKCPCTPLHDMCVFHVLMSLYVTHGWSCDGRCTRAVMDTTVLMGGLDGSGQWTNCVLSTRVSTGFLLPWLVLLRGLRFMSVMLSAPQRMWCVSATLLYCVTTTRSFQHVHARMIYISLLIPVTLFV